MALFISTNRSIGGIEVDATVSESHESTITVTENPVEFGADINDHRIIQPKRLKIRGVVSDDQLGLAGFSSFFGGSSSRSKGAWKDLLELQETGEPFDVQTGLQLYTSMVMSNLTATTTKDNARALDFTGDLQEVRIVNTEQTEFSPTSLQGSNTISQAASSVNKGQIQTKSVPTNSSFLSSALKSIGG